MPSVKSEMGGKMYKLFVNRVQIGNYDSLRMMVETALRIRCISGVEWKGNSLFIKTVEKGEM